MKRSRRVLALAAVMTAVFAGSVPAASATASKSYTWSRSMKAGDCWMYGGAKWTLHSDGTAEFNGRLFTIDGDDAWLMWAHLKDASGAILDDIRVAGSTSTKFVKNLPDDVQPYRWMAKGWFDPALYPLIKGMSLSKHC